MNKKIPVLTLLCVIAISCNAIAVDMGRPNLPRDDDAFLEAVERQAFNYFWEEANPKTGIVYDGSTKRMGGSIASTGFGLSAICVADSRGWISRQEAYDRVLATLKSFHRDGGPGDIRVEGLNGLFFHYIDPSTGKWYKNYDRISTADTADLIAGVITCMEYFKGTEIERLGDDIVRACDWSAFMQDNDGRTHKFIAMGCVPLGLKSSWTNETGLFGRYHGYMDNSFLIYLLGIASPTHPIPVSSWYACQATYKRQPYKGEDVIVPSPSGLAFHYYQHCWLDLRNKKDQAADYFRNSLLAILAQQEYCSNSDDYEGGLWGISSSLSPRGYEAMGAPFGDAYENGTVTPHAIAGGMPFTPARTLDGLKYLAAYHGNLIMGRYGFTDAFNQKKSWVSRDYIGIDQGVFVLMIENFRTGLVWKYFMRNRYIQDALRKIGFVGIIEDFENDAGKGAYSRYEVAGGNGTARIVGDLAMEGRRSLELEPSNYKSIALRIEPDLADFTGFKYVSFWTRNTRDARICVKDTKGASATVDCSSYLESAGWRRYFYSIERMPDISLSNISDITIMMVPSDDSAREPMYIDGVELVYSMVNSNPLKVGAIRLSGLKDASICSVSFDASDYAYRYDIRYSKDPILSQDDFERCQPLDRTFFASGAEREEFFVPMAGEGRYFIGVQAVDNMGQRSKVESAGPVDIKGAAPAVILDDFERAALPSPLVLWPARKSYVSDITLERASLGSRALKAQFQKAPSDVWDYVELDFRRPFDVRPFRYLRIDVFGEDAVLAKLYNSKAAQEEIGAMRPLKKNAWNELTFDIGAMAGDKVDKSRVTKILFFIAPGRTSSGTIYIDNIRLEN